MKRLLTLLLATCAWLGAYEHRIIARMGASYIYRGYSSWVQIMHYWSPNVFTFAVNPATDTITAVGHNFVSGDRVMVTTSGALPGGLNGKREYQVCNISGDTFQFVVYGYGGCSGVGNPEYRIDITDEGVGTHRLGKVMDNGPYPGPYHVYLAPLTGVPSGVTYEVWCERATPGDVCPVEDGKYRSYHGSLFFLIKFTASPTATLGAATITASMTTGTGEPEETISIPLTVEELVPIPSVRPASYPAIPNLATWESTMQVLARYWCDPTSYATAESSYTARQGPIGYAMETQSWFYDGAWAYRQIAKYTGNANWNNCGDYIGDWYRDRTLAFNGGHMNYKAHSAGLKSNCASCDMRNRVALGMMFVNSGSAGTCGSPHDWDTRPTAYMLELELLYGKAIGSFGPSSKGCDIYRTAGFLLAMFDELFRDGTWTYHQTYWDGLVMRELINYFEVTGDQRVPVYVKKALDWLWTNAWNDTTKKLVYNPENKGPRCSYGCADGEGWAWTELIALIVPAAGWYYWYSGDDTYRQRGDEWFKALPRWPEFSAIASDDRVTITAHGLSVDDGLYVIRHPDGSALPGGMFSGQNLYVKSVVDANTITVSTTKSGPTLNITVDGVGAMGLKCGPTGYCQGRDTGKMFTQQFRWSIAYVQWRQGQTPYAP